MAEATKYAPINGGALMTDLRSHFSLLRAKRTLTCAYGFVFCFIAFTIFLAFSPSQNSSSPWFTDIFTTRTDSSTAYYDDSYRSHFSSVLSYLFPNSSSSSSSSEQTISRSSSSSSVNNNQTKNKDFGDKVGIFAPKSNGTVNAESKSNLSSESNKGSSSAFENHVNTAPRSNLSSENNKGSSSNLKNQTQSEDLHSKVGVLEANHSTIGVVSSSSSSSSSSSVPANGDKNIAEKGVIKNFTSSLSKKQSNGAASSSSSSSSSSPASPPPPPRPPQKQEAAEMVKSLMNCDLYDGKWVKDESYPLYKPNSCSLIDEQFNCFGNGRPDHDYYKLKWKPKGCTIPRLNGTHMLEMLRGKRLVFVGDSLNRNMWESLICILKSSVKDEKKVYEESGKHHFRGDAAYAFIFEEYKCRVEFFVSPFLVQPWEVTGKDGKKKETLRLDLVVDSSDLFRTADFILFNTGHWWTHDKTSLGKDYYQEGSHVYDELNVLEAFRKALTTWGRWVDANINPSKTHVMFRGYSASHFSGGQWNSGGQCDHETEPIKNDTYLSPYPSKMTVLERVFRGMKTPVSYLNITRLSDYRKDGHPSMYRKKDPATKEEIPQLQIQDCSHWCLPGVPDAWNELLYAEILVRHAQKRQS